MRPKHSLLHRSLVVLQVLSVGLTTAIIMDVPGRGGQECFEQTLHADADVLLHYAVNHPPGAKINVRVISGFTHNPDADGHQRHEHQQKDSAGGNINFEARASTTYHVCFISPSNQAPTAAVAVHTLITGKHVNIEESVNIGSVRDAETKLHDILALVSRINWEQSYLTETALYRDNVTRIMARRARHLAAFVLFLALCLGVSQLYYLKHLIARRKRTAYKPGRNV